VTATRPEDQRADTPDGDEEAVLRVLRDGDLEILGQVPDASNTTLLAHARLDGTELTCVYKPIAGERPLWDFPDGTLAHREVATYEVSRATGWRIVPPTVLRADGPHGPGMCQQWVTAVERSDLLAVLPADGAGPEVDDAPAGWLPVIAVELRDGLGWLAHRDDPRLARVAALDVVVNNADRKGGHLMTTEAGEVRGVDHGICFHSDDKLRTLLWGFAGRELETDVRTVLTDLAAGLTGGPLRDGLTDLLTPGEVAAAGNRVRELLATGHYPEPGDRRRPIPWPPI
jgi:uncharacterized repeat protein (TIGR03843 family)